MKIDLLIFMSDNALASWSALDVARIICPAKLELVDEPIQFSVQFVETPTQLKTFVQRLITTQIRIQAQDQAMAPTIIISDYFTEDCQGEIVQTPLVKELDELFRSESCCRGLIALTEDELTEHLVTDTVVTRPNWGAKPFRRQLLQVATRLWLKVPPRKHRHNADAIAVTRVTSPTQLRECLALRASVYSALGYLSPEVGDADTTVEMDGYDPIALHLVAVDRGNGNKVMGTARLIVPDRRSLTVRDSALKQIALYQKWIDDIATEEPTALWLQVLENPPPNALPIFDSFAYFEQLTNQQLFFKDQIRPRECCELSRIIVHPVYRGLGISRLLIERAIKESEALDRQYLLLECAPHHEEMYARYGFETIQDEDTKYYARAQRLDTYAVAMRRALSSQRDSLSTAPGFTINTINSTVGKHELFVDEGPAKGCKVAINSLSLGNRELEGLFDQPATRLPDHGAASSHSRQRLNTRSEVPSVGALMLSALKYGSVDNFLEILQSMKGELDISSVQLCGSKGNILKLSKAQFDDEPLPMLRDRFAYWLDTLDE